MIAVLSRTLERALAADFKRLRSRRGSFAPACFKIAAIARTFLTLLRDSWTAFRNWLLVFVVSARAVLRSCWRTIFVSSSSMCFRRVSLNAIRSPDGHGPCTQAASRPENADTLAIERVNRGSGLRADRHGWREAFEFACAEALELCDTRRSDNTVWGGGELDGRAADVQDHDVRGDASATAQSWLSSSSSLVSIAFSI